VLINKDNINISILYFNSIFKAEWVVCDSRGGVTRVKSNDGQIISLISNSCLRMSTGIKFIIKNNYCNYYYKLNI